MEIILNLDDILINEMMDKTNSNSVLDLTSDALLFLNWAIKESFNGRKIISVDKEGNNVKILKNKVINMAEYEGKYD